MAKVTLPPPPDGFEIAPETPAPPAGFVLEAADLPAPPDGFEIQAAAPPPANANIPQLRAPEPKPAWKRALTAVRESMTPLLGPTEAQILADGVTAEDGTIQYKPMGGRVDQEGFFPALSHPMIPLPRMQAPVRSPAEILQDPMWQMMSDVPMIPPETVAAAVNTGAGFMEFAESPLGAATGGIGALGKIVGSTATPRVIAGAYAADIASKTPEAARQAGELSVTGTPQEALESLLQLGVNIALPGVLAAHAVAPGKVQTGTPEGRNAPAQPEVFSEFGSEARAREEAAGPAEPSLNVTKTPIEGGAKPPARAVPAPPEGFVVEGQPQQTTVPELPATLHAQVVKMQEGRAPAVLFTPADTIPEWALKDQRFDVVETTEGRVMFDTAAWTKDEITRLVDNNQMGTVLGYGVPNRPAQATGAVVVRDKAGLELRAVGVNEATAPAVLEAAKRYAGEGDLVALEPLENVIAKRLDRSGTGAAVRTVDATAQAAQYAEGKRYREEQAKAATVPAEAAPRELPADVKVKVEGLDRKTGAPTETAARPAVEVAERHLKEAREAVAQLRGENVERPPDLIDELQNVTRGPVRVPAELQDVVNASRERIARELHNKPWQRLSSAQRKSIDRELKVSTSEGMPADQVLTGLGEKQRDLTVDDFANALLDAAEGRLLEWKKGDSAEVRAMAEEIARAESEAGRANETDRTERAPEDIDPWQETIDALDSLKLDTKGQLHAFGLLPEAWNTLIDLAKLAVRGGRALGDAIDWAITEFKRLNPEATLTDEAGARAQLLVEVPTRATGQKITGSTIISDETKRAIQAYIYDPRSNLKDSEQATGIVMDHGVDAAIQLWRNPPDWMPGAVKSKLLGAITRHLANAERAATDAATKAALVEQQRALWDEALPRITNVAQELQAMNDLVLMSPDAHVARAKRDVAKAGEAEMERHKPETDAMRRALNEGRDAGLEAVKQDPATNAAAREAVNEAIKESAETKRAIVMELAQPWAQSEYILNTAREAVRAKANELLNTQPRPPQFTPAQHLRKILDDLAQRAADIFAGHIQGAEPSVALVDKLMSRLGIDRPQAVKLASSLSKEWDRQLEQARKNLDTRLANARARQERREREADSNAAVDRALRRQLREMNLKLGDAIRQAATTRSATGETIADRVVQASGLTGPKAEALRQRLQARWNELVAEAQRNALAAIENRSGVKVTRKMREAFERLVELDRLAPVEGEAFFKAVRSALKLPEMTEAQAAEIRRLAQRAMEQPEGWRQQQALAALNTYIDQAAGKYKWHDKAMSFYYSGLLASPSTWTANASGNLMMQFSQLATEIMLHPRQTSLILQGFADGMGKGYAAGWHTMRTGEVLGLRLDKIQGSRWLEATKLPGKLDWALTKFRIPGRVMGAQDLIAFSRLAELKWNLIAAEVASKQGLRGTQLAKEVQRLLHNTEADWQTARAQAAQEGLKGNDAYRRAHEIIEQRRDNTLPGSAQRARQYGLDNTFNGEYEGWLGNVGQWLEWGNRNLVVSKLFTPIIRFPIKATQIGLEYSPAGWLYAAKGAWTGKVRGREVNQERMSELMARATYGTLMTAGLVAYLGAYANDDDPPIWLYGAGPADRNQRDALHAETGWIPYSFKTPWGYFSWAESPAAPVFAVLANYFDALKFGKLDEQDAQSRAWFAFMSMPDVLLNKRTLQGLKEAGNFIAAERDPKFAAGTIGRKAAVFLGNDVKMIDQLFDPQVYSADDVQAALLNNFPIARSQGHPVINVFGTPLTRTPEERFFSPVKNDPLVNLLFQKRAWPSMPDRERAFVGNKALGEDYIRPMTNDEYYEWVVVSGNAIRQRLTSNIDRLYTATPNEAQAIVSKVVAEERAKAKPTR